MLHLVSIHWQADSWQRDSVSQREWQALKPDCWDLVKKLRRDLNFFREAHHSGRKSKEGRQRLLGRFYWYHKIIWDLFFFYSWLHYTKYMLLFTIKTVPIIRLNRGNEINNLFSPLFQCQFLRVFYKRWFNFFVFLRGNMVQWSLILFSFYFILLYNTVLVLPYIDMNPPRVYMRSQTWTSLPPPSP